MSYYVIPDIHGNFSGLKQAVDKIMKTFDSGKDVLVFLGDYIDRGEQSVYVLKYLKKLQEQYSDKTVICLLGNHEDMFLNWLKSPLINRDFLLNDYQLRTLKGFLDPHVDTTSMFLTYDYQIGSLLDFGNKTADYARIIKREYKDLIEWLTNLPLYYDRTEQDNVLFIHAGIEETVLDTDWKTYTSDDMKIWKYPISYGNNPYGFSIVSGHVMTDELWKFTEEPCYDIFVTGNHYYVDGASPMNKTLNILKVSKGVYTDFNKNERLGKDELYE